ncbi:MAG: hypothetical protein IKL44_05500 [Clostridia bacterium]|nr:hypothetical protein [Clostridia bacterium]
MKRIISSILLVFTIMLSVLFVPTVTTNAAPAETKRAIAIVFDNSGSMYLPYNKDESFRMAWCRATYAMEVLATMMNASDEMYIYPMHPIEVGGSKYNSSNPLKVTQATASTIRNIYTPDPKATPIETITAAREGLKKAAADEKWLIVLTDGTSFYKGGKDLKDKTMAELKNVLTTCVSEVNTAFLGIGKDAVQPTGISGTYRFISEKANDSADVLEKLTAMCNNIFGRDTLPGKGKTVTFDVSMKKLILFVQGKNIKDVKLEGYTPIGTDEPKYGEKGGGGQGKDFTIDKSLQGVMLTFTDVAAGEYKISHSGDATSIVTYYEPDIDMSVVIKDAAGEVMDPKEELTAGTYVIQYNLVDRDGKETKSDLLGKTNYEIKYTINGEEKVVKADKSGELEIELQPNDTLDGDFTVTYLSGYTIHRTGLDFGWPSGGIKMGPPPAGKLELSLSGADNKYNLTDLESKGKIRVNLVYEGKEVTGDELKQVTLVPTMNGGNAAATIEQDDEGYYVALGPNGTLVDTETGTYTLGVSGIYTTVDGLDSNKAVDKVKFKISDNSNPIKMKVIVEQDYYQISKLKDGKPIKVAFSLGGEPLTEEQMKDLQFDVDGGKLKLITERIPGESAYSVRIDPNSKPKDDSYKIKFTATGKNEIGREVTEKASAKIQVRAWPQWLRILLPILIILLIILLIVMYMRQKVLPKKVGITGKPEYIVSGDPVTGAPRMEGKLKAKKRGVITVQTPNYSNPLAKTGVSVEVEAVSPRYVASNKRRMRVTAVSPIGKNGVESFQFGSKVFNVDYETGKFVAPGMKPGEFKPYEVSGTIPVKVYKSVEDISVNFDCKIAAKKK